MQEALLYIKRGGLVVEIIISILLIWIGITDWKEKRIPNKLLLAFLVLTLIQTFLLEKGNLIWVLLGSLIVPGFLLFVMLLKRGAFGMGDVKLMGISGILLGLRGNISAFVYGIFLAAAFCIIGICLKKISRKSEIAFGPFLCMGILIVLFTIG